MIVRNSRFKQVLPDNFTYKGTKYTKAYAKGKQLFGYSEDDYKYQYFTVESLEDGNVITLTKGSSLPATLLSSVSYSTDNGSTWTTMTNDGSSTQTITVNLDNGEKVLFMGEGSALANNYEINGAQYRTTFSSAKTYNVYGNIMSLLHGDDFEDKTTLAQNYAFCGLFYQSTGLVSAENLIIPVTVINVLRAFTGTFNGCTSLTTPPQFAPTTISAQHGCQRMFNGCTALTKTVDLSKLTNLTGASACIEMFRGCTSLVKTSELPATTLGDYCYYRMFYGCTSLTTAPELPAATLTSNCYNAMFYGCTSLNYIKCLATDISASSCTTNWVYNVAVTGTFIKADTMTGWTIDSANGIPTGWTLHNYENCTVTLSVNDSSYGTVDGAGTYNTGDLVTIKANALDSYRFVGWYDGSTLVSQNQGYTFEILTDVSYQAVFESGQVDYSTQYFTIESQENDCEITISHTTGLWDGGDYVLNYSKDNGANWNTLTFTSSDYTKTLSLNNGEKALIRNVSNGDGIWCALGSSNTGHMYIRGSKKHVVYGNIMSMFYGSLFTDKTTIEDYACPGLFWLDECLVDATNLIMPATTLTTKCYNNMFKACKSLIGAPTLPATTLANNCYSYMFQLCTSLAQAPALPATTMAQSCYYSMFASCYSLSAAPTLPATTLAHSCYEYMFRNCYSLTQAPSLPATTLETMCYFGMFDGCTSLEYAPSLRATTLANSCYNLMFRNTKIEQLSVYAVSSSWEIDFGAINIEPNPPITGIYFVKPNAVSYILEACPTGWAIQKSLS